MINYWNSRHDTLKSASKALVFNLFSDFTFILALVLIALVFSSTDIRTVNAKSLDSIVKVISFGHVQLNALVVISFLLLISASIKSAQFIFHAWLPDSMEAPAPASALIHSATLVSAGIFLLARLSDV